MARALDISEENLEDLLAYDDLFLDYFNAFLCLPVFATPLYYNRLTGTFIEAEGPGLKRILSVQNSVTPPYGATDEERDAMLQWARDERLPLFLRTNLFREFKLCKLLLRPLDERYSAGRGGSSKIRGYSRQTESYVSSLSNSADNSAPDADFEDEGGAVWQPTYRRSLLYRYPRPGSRAFSLPSRVGLGPYNFGNQSENESANNVKRTSKNEETEGTTRKSSNSATIKRVKKENTGEWAKPTPSPEKNTILLSDKPQYDPTISSSKEVTFHKEDTAITTDQKLVVHSANSEQSNKNSVVSMATRSKSSGDKRSPIKRVATPKRRNSAKKKPVNENKENEVVAADEAVIEDFDEAFGEVEPPPTAEALVEFADDDDGISEAQTEKDVERLEVTHKMSLQAMKEQVLSCVEGMQDFVEFLGDTSGWYLYHFWLDCEEYKDSMEEYDEEENISQRNSLFRAIQDRYKLTLTPQALKQIQLAARDSGLSQTVFIRTQYDILRRLRMYWLPRFLIHKERLNQLSMDLRLQSSLLIGEQYLMMSRQSTNMFPSISLAKSMPVNAEDVLQIAKTKSWYSLCQGRSMNQRVKSAKPHIFQRKREPTLKEKLITALNEDKVAGGPFRNYLERHSRHEAEALCNLMFWQDVAQYVEAEDRSADRLLRMVQAWNIYNLYISQDSKFCIGLDDEQRDKMHTHLLQCRDLVGVDIFAEAKKHSIQQLENPWIRFLKEDMKAFIDAHLNVSEGAATSVSEYEVVIDKSDNRFNLYVKAPRPWVKRYPPSTASERGERLHTAISLAQTIDASKKAERKKKERERREIMEKERKKAIREAKKHMNQKHSKKPKSSAKKEGEEGEEGEDGKSQAITATEIRTLSQSGGDRLAGGRADAASDVPEKIPTFIESVKKNKSIMPMLKKFVQENESKDIKDMLNMYLDIDAYQHMEKDKANRVNRDKQATFICRTYIDPSSKKHVAVNDKVYQRLKVEKERPKSPTLRDCQSSVVASLEETFNKFWNTQLEIYGDGKNMAQMSKAELAMRQEDLSMLTGFKGKGGGGGRGHRGGRADGRAQPTREDQVEFLLQLTQASAGQLPIRMLYFYKYLVKYSEDESAYMTGLDRDLFFYFEVQKFKDGSHQYADDELLKRKVQSLLDCYLESNSTPAVQINVPSDISGKAARSANKYLQGKEISSTIFDEAQYAVFKNLLPYWAGFIKSYKPPSEDKKTAPLTKPQRERKKRLEEIKAWKTPSTTHVTLPALPKGSSVAAFTFSVADGIKWRDQQDGLVGEGGELGAESEVGTGIGSRARKISVVRIKRTSTNMTEASQKSIPAK